MLEPVITEHKPVKRVRLRWVLILLLSLGVLLALVIPARPEWQTIYLSSEAEGGTRVSVQLPRAWRWQQNSDWAPMLALYPPKPTGLPRWWSEHILKMNMSERGDRPLTISMNQRPAESAASGHRDLEIAASRITASCHRSFHDVKTTWYVQQGMSVFELDASGSLVKTAITPIHLHYVLLNGYDPVRKRSIMINARVGTAQQNYPFLKPTMDEIIRRLRLVQK